MKIGSAIQQIRKKKGISQLELSVELHISQAALSQIENNVKKPSEKTLENICKALDTPKALFYVMSIEENDIPSEKKDVYDALFQSIKNLVVDVVENHPNLPRS